MESMLSKLLVPGALVALAAAAAPAYAAPPVPINNTAELSVDSSDGSVQSTTKVLSNRSTYLLTVSGTSSYFAQSLWNQPAGSFWVTCGTTARVATPSPGEGAGKAAGIDSEFLFAGVAKRGCGNFKPPIRDDHFTVSTGGPFSDLTPIMGAPAEPSADHEYVYAVVGTGAPLSIKIVDTFYGDNNGVYKVTIDKVSPPVTS